MNKLFCALGLVTLTTSALASTVRPEEDKAATTKQFTFACADRPFSHPDIVERPGFNAVCSANIGGDEYRAVAPNTYWAVLKLADEICDRGSEEVQGLTYTCSHQPQ